MPPTPSFLARLRPYGLIALLLLPFLLGGCGRERLEAAWPNGKPKIVRTYGLWGGAKPANLAREQTFFFNGHKETDVRFRKGRRHGRYEDFWSNGQRKSQGQYQDGRKEGEWEIYHNQYSLASKGRYRDDKKEGEWMSLWENGALRSQGSFAGGREIGTWKEWSAKGEPVSENSCFETNAEGRYVSFHANKTVKEEYTCRNGMPNGAYVKKDPDGTVIERGAFDAQGRKHGAWEAFRADGKRASLLRYAGGMEQDSSYAWDSTGRLRERAHFDSGTGERLAYDSLGHLIERRHFLKGRPEGESWSYWPQGGKRALTTYKDGKPVDMKKWHPDGRLMAVGFFEDGHRAGEWKDWWGNGTLKEISHFQGGALHGERRFYDEHGKLVRTTRYEHGYPAEGRIPKGLASPRSLKRGGDSAQGAEAAGGEMAGAARKSNPEAKAKP